MQHDSGWWLDKWHVSPYYCTLHVALALQRVGIGDRRGAIEKAITWILHTQRKEGSWGIWDGTLEETAYALLALLLLIPNIYINTVTVQAIKRGIHFLELHFSASSNERARMPLWLAKELYAPERIVQSAIISALYLCERTGLRRPLASDMG